jgi:hypothetical protein
MRIRVAAACLLLGCSGDLTLPGSTSRPTSLEALSGDNQRARIGEVLDDPLVVQVRDAASQPLPGATVRFDFLADLPGADLQPTAAVTDADGRAEAKVRLALVEGEQVIVARVDGADPALNAQFEATALPLKGKGKGGDGNDDEDDEEDD